MNEVLESAPTTSVIIEYAMSPASPSRAITPKATGPRFANGNSSITQNISFVESQNESNHPN